MTGTARLTNGRQATITFASQITSDADASEETYSNVKIDCDDAVASVSFDFVFLSNGKPANVGKEAWLMVKTMLAGGSARSSIR